MGTPECNHYSWLDLNTRYFSHQKLGLPQEAPDADADVVASLVSYLVKPEAYFITGE